MNDSRLSTGLLKGSATPEEIATLREDMAKAQKGHGVFPWWALREAIEEWKKSREPKNDRKP